ncbi:MAG: hypothetical protein HC803_07285, partial [Saprospiraceae bacterium]|nr:hypothetical protein [Saprospiraceae bacterium]
MKKLSLLFAVLCVAFIAEAQDNIVKIGVGSMFNRTLNLEYERVLTEKQPFLEKSATNFPIN